MPYDNRVISNQYGPFRAHPRDPNVLFTKGPNGHTIRKWSLSRRLGGEPAVCGSEHLRRGEPAEGHDDGVRGLEARPSIRASRR